MPHQERLNIAVFIDFDNIEIGVKTTLGEHFDIGIILDGIKERGEVVTKIAYADWTRAGEYSRALTQHAIRLVQRNLTPGGDKNGADINLALDALEMAFTHPHINAYVIVGGDSDFLSLVEKLKQYDKKVFVVGGRAFTSVILQRNCHEFIAYENLDREQRPRGRRAAGPAAPTAVAPIAQAFPIVRRALKILADREVSPQTGLLKSTLLQLDSTFSERNYGASSFLDFVEKLAQAGLVQLKHSGRSVMVELNEGFSSEGEPAETAPAEGIAGGHRVAAAAPGPRPVEQPAHVEPPAGPQVGTQRRRRQNRGPDSQERDERAMADVRAQREATAPRVSRRRQAGPTAMAWKALPSRGGFDERQYGFGGLMDLLRACQREGLVRVERDRRGGLRVFPGQALQRTDVPHVQTPREPAESQAAVTAGPDRRDARRDTEPEEPQRIPVDTTAELLGRANAKPRRPRAQQTRVGSAAPRAPRKAAAAPRKPAARRRRARRKQLRHGRTRPTKGTNSESGNWIIG